MSNASPNSKDPNDGLEGSRNELFRLGWLLFIALVMALLLVGMSTLKLAWERSFGVVGLTLLVGLACGAGLGFLFGIPKTIVSATSSGSSPGSPPTLRANTNLEELSDWLTKIIVGLGLTQLYQVTGLLTGFRALLQSYSEAGSLTPLIGTLALVFSLVVGFLWLYLETRTILSHVLKTFDQSLVSNLTTALTIVTKNLPGGGTELAPAADALKSVAQSVPSSPALRSFATKALAAAGRTGEALSLLQTSGTTSVADQINRMLVALYNPGGYQETLALAVQLKTNREATARADYWSWTAAAYGQQYHDLLAKSAAKVDLDACRDNVLEAVRKSVAIDPKERQRLFWLANPTISPNPQDDDLADFQKDADFVTLVGTGTVDAAQRAT